MSSTAMASTAYRVAGIAFGLALPLAAVSSTNAQLLVRKDLSLNAALTIAQTASESCTAQGYRVSVTVVGRLGEVIVQLRGDDAPPHTIENSQRKAYTARTFRTSSAEFAKRVLKPGEPPSPQTMLTGVVAAAGALPIVIGEEVIGAVGVSGAPGGEKDEACAKTGIDKVASQLK
jgi:uncharacterized protein GlcG (DUF336 family)